MPEDNLVGCYVRSFTLEDAFKGKRTILTFEGVETAFYVWLNGRFVGYAEDSFTPSRFDVTDHLVEGENLLAVEVYHRSSGAWLEDQDFWRLSGIIRPVFLEAWPERHVRDIFLNTDLTADFSQASLRLRLKLDLPAADKTRLRLSLTDPNGKVVLQDERDADVEMDFYLPVADPLLWSAEAPHLYHLTLSLLDGAGHVTEAVPQRVGFRQFELKDGVMRLNGKRIVFRGVNRHDFNPRRGRSVTLDDMLWDVQFFKQNKSTRCAPAITRTAASSMRSATNTGSISSMRPIWKRMARGPWRRRTRTA